MVTDVVVREGGVPVPDQHAVLVWKPLCVVRPRVEEAEVVRTGAETVVVARVLAILRQVVMGVVDDVVPGRAAEAIQRPTVVTGLGVLREDSRAASGDGEVVVLEPTSDGGAVRPVPKLQLDRLAGVGREVSRDWNPSRVA